MIKAVLWDIDGTLLNFRAAEEKSIRACFARMNLGRCTDDMLADYSAINTRYWQALEKGEMTRREILTGRFREFFAKYGIDPGRAEEFNLLYQNSLGDTAVFNPGGEETVKALSGKVIQRAVTNGTKAAQTKKLKNSGLDKLLDYVFISEETGAEKPNVKFFQPVFQALSGISKNEILIVGDSLTSDMQGGLNAGIKTCWFNPAGSLADIHNRFDYVITRLKQVEDIVLSK